MTVYSHAIEEGQKHSSHWAAPDSPDTSAEHKRGGGVDPGSSSVS
jgi:hypothetical protein